MTEALTLFFMANDIEVSKAEQMANIIAASQADAGTLREAVVVEMENEGVVTWGDDGHRERFLALAASSPATAGTYNGYPMQMCPDCGQRRVTP